MKRKATDEPLRRTEMKPRCFNGALSRDCIYMSDCLGVFLSMGLCYI